MPILNRNSSLMTLNTGPGLLPKSRVQDIDTEEDWAIAARKKIDVILAKYKADFSCLIAVRARSLKARP